MAFWKNLNIGTKIIAVILPCILIIISVISFLSIKTSQTAIEAEAFNKLVAIRELKAGQIESYFAQIRSQIETFSENKMIVDAMKDFSDGYYDLETQLNFDAERVETANQNLKKYYQQQFLPKLSSNMNKTADLQNYLPKSKIARVLQDLYISSNIFKISLFSFTNG